MASCLLVLAFLALAAVNAQLTPPPEIFDLPLKVGNRPLFPLDTIEQSFGKAVHQQAADTNYEKYYDQKLDQTDSSNSKTFKQRYFVNKQWKSSTNGAVHILYLEGENPASATKVSDTKWPHVNLAKDLGATAWSLEHRWRGKSQPLKKTFPQNFKQFLSTTQAIEDIAAFIKAQNKASGETSPKWIVVGQTYGGNLALWFRQKYPDLTVGAISDSAAIIPTIDFFQFESFVEEAYSNYSYECWHGIKFAAKSIRNEIQYQEGVDRLNDQLKLRPPIDDNKVDYKSFQNLHHNLLQLFEVPVVYNKVNIGPFASSNGIDDICKIMSNETVKDIQRVFLQAKSLYTAVYGSKDNFPGVANSYEALSKYLRDDKGTDQNQVSARSWLYQQCYEYGQFITTDNAGGLFYNTVPNDYNIGLCADAFGAKIYSYTVDDLQYAVGNTSKKFDTTGNYKGTNALIFNGAHDPWSLLGVKSVSDKSSTLINLKDIGHAAVLQPPVPAKDPSVLKDARNAITTQAKKWVKGSAKKTLAAALNLEEKTAHHKTEPKQEEPITFPEIHNWEAKIHYSEDGEPPKHVASYKFNTHKVGSGKEPKTNLLKGRAYTFVDQMRRRRVELSNSVKDFGNLTMKRHYLKTGYIIQDTDHFVNNGIQFAQRFFQNDQHQRDRDGPRFLLIGAEAAVDYYYVDDDFMQMYRWGKDFKAVLYCLEHRFFGYSAPFPNTSVPILKRYLTNEQVLADTAVFIRSKNKEENNTVKPRWVVFGGSYGGNLVATFRLRYPKLSLGGIASSAPLQAKTDFWEYMQRVEKDVKRFTPAFCPDAIRGYFGWIRRKMNTRPGRREVKGAFCIGNHWDQNYISEKDAELLLASNVMRIGGATQYDSEKHRYLNYLCKYYQAFDKAYNAEKQNRARDIHHAFIRIEKEINGGKKITDEQFIVKADERDDYYEQDDNYSDYDDGNPSRYSDSQEGEPEVTCPAESCPYGCYSISYNAMLQGFQNVYRDCYRGHCSDETRLWFWLSASQWGYAESNNYGYNYFETALPINYILDIITNMFGSEYNRAFIDKVVAQTNKAYGGAKNYNGTNTVFVNGSEDPWMTLSVYEPLQKSTTSILIDGTSHCVDMNREYEHDMQVLKDARKQIKKQIVRWVRRSKKTTK